jgi:sugar-specific transcriptional regulator TrmB
LTNSLIQILKGIGLNEKEARLYIATLELGDSPASHIAKQAKINRVSCYDLLEKLEKQGLISSYIKDGTKTFSALSPKELKQDVDNRAKRFSEAVPDLQRLSGKAPHARIRYYEGLEGIKHVYSDTLNSKTEILNYADSLSIRKYWPNYEEQYVQKRIDARIYLRGIAPNDETGQKVIDDNEKSHREIRLVKSGPFSFKNEINIYDNKISIISFGEKTVLGMIIEDEEIANTQRAIFMMAWEFAGMRV